MDTEASPSSGVSKMKSHRLVTTMDQMTMKQNKMDRVIMAQRKRDRVTMAPIKTFNSQMLLVLII